MLIYEKKAAFLKQILAAVMLICEKKAAFLKQMLYVYL